MIKVKLREEIREFESGISVRDVAASIGSGLLKAACTAKIDGEVCDIRTKIEKDCTLEILTFADEDGKKAFRHTASHILAQAVKRLYPQAKLAIGPATSNGFYYDFDCDISFTPDVLEKIESEMKKIVKEDITLNRSTLSRTEAIEFFKLKGEEYKVELICGLPENVEISLYCQGEFTDLCAGEHIASTGVVKSFKLTSSTGAYWRGDSNKKMLQRIYGTAFTKAAELEEYLQALEEAKKRDHNKLGRELELFTTSDVIGQGLPIMLPKGTKILQILQRFVEDEEAKRGWQQTRTPLFAKRELYQISGHWDHYRDGMFILGDKADLDDPSKEVFALRPMTCPFQYQAYLNKSRSYRDLPLRYSETSTLFRNESSGEMHGLIRVRQFTISEGHLMCLPEQLEDEFKGCLEVAIFMLKTLGLYEDVSYRFSQWDPGNTEKYIGTATQWDEAQSAMERILKHLEIPHKIGLDEAAFYGPKLDIQIKNVHGKEDTLITIQIDLMLAEKFGMEYVAADATKKNPYIIHRTSIGCYERTLALLIEKYAGAFPMWLAPEQVRILPIADRHHEGAFAIRDRLANKGIRVTVDDRSEKIGYKIREAQLMKLPYMLVVGDNELENDTVSVRERGKGDIGVMSVEEYLALVINEVETKIIK